MHGTDSADEQPEHPMPEDPRSRPEATVDALEERVLGEVTDQDREADPEGPAQGQDIDLNKEKTGEGHVSQEPAD